MFNVGPMELIVLGLVAIIVFGPERLPQLARDAAQMIKALREVAQGATTQLREELGPEFADVDLRNLNPKTAIRRALLGEDFELGTTKDAFLGAFTGQSAGAAELSGQINGAVRDAVGSGVSINPKQAIKDALLAPPKQAAATPASTSPVSMTKVSSDSAPAESTLAAPTPAAPSAEVKPYVGDFDAT